MGYSDESNNANKLRKINFVHRIHKSIPDAPANIAAQRCLFLSGQMFSFNAFALCPFFRPETFRNSRWFDGCRTHFLCLDCNSGSWLITSAFLPICRWLRNMPRHNYSFGWRKVMTNKVRHIHKFFSRSVVAVTAIHQAPLCSTSNI